MDWYNDYTDYTENHEFTRRNKGTNSLFWKLIIKRKEKKRITHFFCLSCTNDQTALLDREETYYTQKNSSWWEQNGRIRKPPFYNPNEITNSGITHHSSNHMAKRARELYNVKIKVLPPEPTDKLWQPSTVCLLIWWYKTKHIQPFITHPCQVFEPLKLKFRADFHL